MSTKMEDRIEYKISYGCTSLLWRIVFSVCKLLWRGTVKICIENHFFIVAYAVLGIATFIFYLIGMSDIYLSLIVLSALMAITLGIYHYIKEAPIRKRRKYFNDVFEKIKLSSQGQNPYYLYEKEINEYIYQFSFKTVIPLQEWVNKKDDLQMYFDIKIVDIAHCEKSYQIINIAVERKPLPYRINWKDYDPIEKDKDILDIGKSIWGNAGMDLTNHPHAFVAGETGSGKSNILKCMIHQCLVKGYDVGLIDFKRGVSFSSFREYVDIQMDYDPALKLLESLVDETKRRLDLFRNTAVDNINDYNRLGNHFLARKVLFIDELAELLKTRDKELRGALIDTLETLTRLSRAVGIHLIMGIQRPDATIISGQIKNNVSYRICGRFVDKEPSRIMLGDNSASNLPNIKGRFIVKGDDILEVQSFYYENSSQPAFNFYKATRFHELIQNAMLNEETEDNAKLPQKEVLANRKDMEFNFSDFKK